MLTHPHSDERSLSEFRVYRLEGSSSVSDHPDKAFVCWV